MTSLPPTADAASPPQRPAEAQAPAASQGQAAPADGATTTSAPPAQARPAETRVSGRDLEFLPAALEILETPPAPRQIAFMLTICGFAAAALAWSFFGKLDVHATAWGKIEASGGSKVVQPLESGKIATIAVADGERVAAGDLLIALDDAEAKADASAMEEGFLAARAERARRRAAVETARAIMRGEAPTDEIGFDPETPDALRSRERAVFDADRRFLVDGLANLDKQIAQRETTIQRLDMSIEQQEKAIRTAEERVDVRESSVKLNVGTKINLFDARESLLKSQAQIASDRGQQLEARAAIAELHSQKAKSASSFIADNETKLAEAERKSKELAQQKAKAEAKLARTRLVAPIDGVVQQMSATTIGQVVTTGQQLLSIAPLQGDLQVEVFVSNVDIGFVHVGQTAEVKVDAFPFTRFGTVPARVEQIAADAIDEQEAKRRQSNVIAAPQAAPASQPGQPQPFVFPVRLSLDRKAIDVYGRRAALTPGMTVTAEIKTDQRRVIDYLLSPIAKIGSEAMRER